MKKIFTIIANVLLVILMIIGFLVAFSLLPIKNNFKLLSVMSGSMEPTIKTGELVIAKPSNTYQVGDIITFNNQGADGKKSTTTHRIVEKKEDNGEQLYRTKGDANNTVDMSWTKSSNVVGKYRFGIRYFGYLMGYLKTLPGLIIIIVIPATVIIYEEVKKIKKEAKEILDKRRAKKKSTKKISSEKPSKKSKSEISGDSKPNNLQATTYKLSKGGGKHAEKDKKNN